MPVLALPAGAASAPEVVASGLDNPYKLTFGPDGDLYVAEAGIGGEAPCTLVHQGDVPDCYGATGAIVRIADGDGDVTRVVEGLPSIAEAGGNAAVGPHDVAVAPDGTLYVIVGLGGDDADREALGSAGARFGAVLEIEPGATEATVLSDVTAFEEAENPDGGEVDTNPFGLELTVDGRPLAVDAGGNVLLDVTGGEIELVGPVFEAGSAPAPPFLGLPPGTMVPVQAVPTAVEQAPDDSLYVSQLTGFPFPVGGANVFAIAEGSEQMVAEGGFTNIMDIAFDAAGSDEGTLYVLEYASNSILSPDPAPQLVQVRADGTRKVLLSSELVAPGGVTVGPDGMVYVTNGSVLAGGGSVLRVDPTVARDPAVAEACPPADVPGSGFTDVARSVHQEAIECLAWWEVVNGVSATSFEVGRVTTRGEVAAVLARLLHQAGVTFEDDPATAFSDTAGHVHAVPIAQLGDAGVVRGYTDGTFRPDRPVSRAEAAALLMRAYELATDDDLGSGPDAFDDDDGNVHEDSVDRAAAAGWVNGTSAGTFEPDGSTNRAQLASMTARMLSTLVDAGEVALPA